MKINCKNFTSVVKLNECLKGSKKDIENKLFEVINVETIEFDNEHLIRLRYKENDK